MKIRTIQHQRSAGRMTDMSRRRLLACGSAAALAAPLAGCGLFEDDEKPILVGKRENVLTVGAGLTVDADDKTPITLPAAQPVADWPQPGRVPSHEAVNAELAGLKERWSVRVGPERLTASLAPQPVVADGVVYAMGADGVLSAFRLASGEPVWHTQSKPKKMRSSNVGGGLSVAGGTVYVVDGVAESLALDAKDGTIKWRVDVGTPGRSAPTVVGNRMVFGTIDERLVALETSHGRTLWSYTATPSDTVVFGQPAPAIADNVILAGFGSGDIAAVRLETGDAIWSDTLGAVGGRNSIMDFSSIHGLPVISDGTAYAISVGQVLTSIDMRSGRRLWERTVSGKDGLVIVGEWLFVLSTDQQLACLDKTSGHVRWVSQLPRFQHAKSQKGAISWSGPLLVGGRLICVSDFAKLGMISADPVTGALSEVVRMRSPMSVAPVTAQGRVLVASDDGRLTAYG